MLLPVLRRRHAVVQLCWACTAVAFTTVRYPFFTPTRQRDGPRGGSPAILPMTGQYLNFVTNDTTLHSLGQSTTAKSRRRLKRKQNNNKVDTPSKATVSAAEPLVQPHELKTIEEMLDALKKYRKANASRKIADICGVAIEKGIMNLQLMRALARAEIQLGRPEVASEILTKCQEVFDSNPDHSVSDYVELVKLYCKIGELKSAREVLENLGLKSTTLMSQGRHQRISIEDAVALLDPLGRSYVKAEQPKAAYNILLDMTRAGCTPSLEYCNLVLQMFGRQNDVEGLFDTFDAMRACGLKPDTEAYTHLSNALVKTVDFVAGAVSMDTLPARKLQEAVFIGRSNVGKSSLLNMICNRKDLAYVSKQPGKTQQFNYFTVNDKTKSSFYLVDIPGVGYAKVSQEQRGKWVQFFEEYLTQRETLRVVFHLMDSRHGPLEQDLNIMELMQKLPPHARYVAVLTKADKNNGKISIEVVDQVRQALDRNGLGDTPVVVTSAVNRLGRDDMWRYLSLAIKRSVPGKLKEKGEGRIKET